MTASAPAFPNTAQTAWLVAEREIGSKLRSRVFVVSTLVLVLLLLGGVVWGGLTAASPPRTSVAVTSATAYAVGGIDALKVTEVATPHAAVALVRDGRVDAALIPDAASAGFDYAVIAKTDAPAALLQALAKTPRVQLLDHSGRNNVLRYLVALGFGVAFFMAASLFGSTIAQSVVEEKSTRVVEILISAIPVRTLLTGKVIGNTILAMGQILLLVAVTAVGLGITGQGAVLAGLAGPLAWFAVFFLFGFVLLAALFSAAGAMVSRQEDVGATIAPLSMLILLPYVLVLVFNGNPTVLGVMSYVPFSAPVAMPLRLYLGEAHAWEPVVSLVILAATCAVAIRIGSRIYRNSLLRMGARVKLAEALARGR
ncbi:MAG TPA: ABC transporter permease [Microbacterium sp.]|nr:ABC transporter permease [Microbacterium sp.]